VRVKYDEGGGRGGEEVDKSSPLTRRTGKGGKKKKKKKRAQKKEKEEKKRNRGRCALNFLRLVKHACSAREKEGTRIHTGDEDEGREKKENVYVEVLLLLITLSTTRLGLQKRKV